MISRIFIPLPGHRLDRIKTRADQNSKTHFSVPSKDYLRQGSVTSSRIDLNSHWIVGQTYFPTRYRITLLLGLNLSGLGATSHFGASLCALCLFQPPSQHFTNYIDSLHTMCICVITCDCLNDPITLKCSNTDRSSTHYIYTLDEDVFRIAQT